MPTKLPFYNERRGLNLLPIEYHAPLLRLCQTAHEEDDDDRARVRKLVGELRALYSDESVLEPTQVPDYRRLIARGLLQNARFIATIQRQRMLRELLIERYKEETHLLETSPGYRLAVEVLEQSLRADPSTWGMALSRVEDALSNPPE